ncbi:PIN domain-containing protein [Methylobacterium sp. A54F]
MIVLDTNVISELMRAAPDPAAMGWLARQPRDSLFTTALNQAEIFYGLGLLPAGQRRDGLVAAARAIFGVDLAGHVLPFDGDAAMAYAEIAALRRRSGHPISQIDGQIAAIAATWGAGLATRNGRDFTGCGLTVVNPWTER